MGPSLRAHHRPTKFFNGPSARHSINCSWRRFCAAFSPLIFCSASLRAVSRKAVTFGGFHPVKYCHVSTPGELPPRLNRVTERKIALQDHRVLFLAATLWKQNPTSLDRLHRIRSEPCLSVFLTVTEAGCFFSCRFVFGPQLKMRR